MFKTDKGLLSRIKRNYGKSAIKINRKIGNVDK